MARQKQLNIKMPDELRERLKKFADSKQTQISSAAKTMIKSGLDLEDKLEAIRNKNEKAD